MLLTIPTPSPEVLALITSLAALVVSLLAVFLASLRRADIVVDVASAHSGFDQGTSWSAGRPETFDLWIAVSVWNTGAQGGLLEGLGAFDFKGNAIWTDNMRTIGLYEKPNKDRGRLLY